MKKLIPLAVLAAAFAAGCSMFRWSGSPPPVPAAGAEPAAAPPAHPAPLPADVVRSTTPAPVPTLKP